MNWHPTDWYEMNAGRMPMPLYTTPMVWSSNINPEGAFEKFKYTIDNVDLFADFGQLDYQDPSSASEIPSSDTFLLTWQVGANVKIGEAMSFKIAPMLYTYAGVGTSDGLNTPFVGQGVLAKCRRAGRKRHVWPTTKRASMTCSFWKYRPSLISKSGKPRWEHCRRVYSVILPIILMAMIGHALPIIPIPWRFPA